MGLVSIGPGILQAAEVILHSMRGNELLLMTATPDVGSRLRCCGLQPCAGDRSSLPLVEQSLRQNRSQLMRCPRCTAPRATSAPCDRTAPQEIGLQSPTAAS